MEFHYTGMKTVHCVFKDMDGIRIKFEGESCSHSLNRLETICDKMGYKMGKKITGSITDYELLKLTHWLRGKEIRCRVNNTSLKIIDIQVNHIVLKSRK